MTLLGGNCLLTPLIRITEHEIEMNRFPRLMKVVISVWRLSRRGCELGSNAIQYTKPLRWWQFWRPRSWWPWDEPVCVTICGQLSTQYALSIPARSNDSSPQTWPIKLFSSSQSYPLETPLKNSEQGALRRFVCVNVWIGYPRKLVARLGRNLASIPRQTTSNTYQTAMWMGAEGILKGTWSMNLL